MRVLVVHGPNLNLLGTREPEIYGSLTLEEINQEIKNKAQELQMELKIFQSNHEGTIIDFIHENKDWAQGMVINPAAYTHYSIAIRDAISATQIKTVEVHLSNIESREDFRKISVIKDVCHAQISGHGLNSYLLGLEKLKE